MVDGGPAGRREIVLHRLGDGVAVGVVRRQIGRLLVLAEGLDQHRADRRRRGLAVEVLAEAVAHAVLAGGVVGAGDAAHEQHLFALRQLVQARPRPRSRSAGDQHRLVLGDEALLRLHRFVRLGGGVGDAVLHFLAEHALGGLGRDLLDQLMAAVDVLDRELVALELVFALHRIGAGARHGNADEHRGAGRTGRIGADRRLVFGEGRGITRQGSIVPPANPAAVCNSLRRDTTRPESRPTTSVFHYRSSQIYIVTRPTIVGRSEDAARTLALINGARCVPASAAISLHDMIALSMSLSSHAPGIYIGIYIVLRYNERQLCTAVEAKMAREQPAGEGEMATSRRKPRRPIDSPRGGSAGPSRA